MNFRKITVTVFSLWLIALSGCSGRLFRVAPRPVSPASDLSATAAADSLEVSAYAFTDDDRAFEQFGANLPLAGLLAVDVKLLNHAQTPLNPRALRFVLRDATGQQLRQIEPRKALKRLMKYYDVGFYVIEARRRTLAALEALALPLAAPLNAQEARRGLLFFETKSDATALTGLTLTVENRETKTTVTTQLN
ncbi:MAG TPA: hypothetical protein VNQ79_00525 [Blastocatellia bacterium]|nr:hypothetical protein [Blastocatellia bacterium]